VLQSGRKFGKGGKVLKKLRKRFLIHWFSYKPGALCHGLGDTCRRRSPNAHFKEETKLNRKLRCLLVFGLCIAMVTVLRAQSTTGTILGQVTDSSGAVVPKVQVTTTNVLTGEKHSIASNDQGQYVVPHLEVGEYRIEVQAAGFKHSIREGILLTVNQEARVDVVLQIGNANESVEVHADTAQVNTYTPEVGELVDSKKVVDLPLNGRNVYSLLVTLPGASSINAQTVPTRDNNTFVVNGGRSTTNSCFIDGGFNNDIWRNHCSTPPNPDAVQEFRLLSSNSDVEFGRMPGAFMNILTKSGTNQFHGTAYEFLRNDALDATTYFQSSVTPLKQNQYGFSVGGPVIRKKAFAFGSWEQLKQRTSSQINSIAVPTTLERKGDFSQAKTKPINPATGLRYNNDQLTGMDSVGVAITNALPAGTNSDGTYTASAGTPVDEWQYILKGDYQLTDKQKFTVSWFHMNTTQNNPFAYFNDFPGFGERVDGVKQHNLVVNHTWTTTNNLLNEARFNMMRRETPWKVVDGKTLTEYGSNFAQGALTSVAPRIEVSGRFTAGTWDADGLDHSIGGSDTITLIKGKHNIKIGTFVMAGYYSEVGASTGGGSIYDGGDLTGNPLADFMLGYSTTFSEDSGDHPDESARYWHTYAQDTWQVNSRITFTAGVRYEITTPLVWTVNYIPTFRKGVQSTVYPNAPTGLLFYGDKGVDRAGRPSDYNNIAPRLGLAIDPFGTGKTSIRAGYGIYYLAAYGDGIRAPQPYVLSVSINGDKSLVDPWASYSGGNPFPYKVPTGSNAKFQTPMSLAVFGDNAATPYLSQTSLTIQQQVTKDMNVQVGYVGTISRKMSANVDQNNPVYSSGATSSNADSRRPYMPGVFQSIGTYLTGFNASYNALQVVVNQRLSHGLGFNANYSFAKGLDLVSSDNYNGGLGFTDSSKPGRDKGPTDGLAHHIFNFSGTYNTPKIRNFGFAGKQVLSGWQVNGIVSMRTGTLVNVTSGVDSNADNVWNDRPNLVGNPNVSGNRAQKIAKYFNPDAFTAAPAGTYGNVGRNFLTGPGYWNADLSFFRMFPLWRAQSLQFRAELFNAFNHANLNNPDAGLLDSNVGRITSASTARIVQFGLKYSF
jgi:hypothetical protein